MSSIGLVIPEITCEIWEFWENKHNFCSVKSMAVCKVLKHEVIERNYNLLCCSSFSIYFKFDIQYSTLKASIVICCGDFHIDFEMSSGVLILRTRALCSVSKSLFPFFILTFISRINEPIPGIFVLIWMHFPWWFQI